MSALAISLPKITIPTFFVYLSKSLVFGAIETHALATSFERVHN